MPRVSIIITVYNGAKYLTECLESVLSQTLTDTEIICVDDASTDETPRILEKYRNKIQILTNEVNCMAGESRNRGLQAANGEYVIFLDADDIFEPDMLEKAYAKAKCCGADVCIFKEDLFSDTDKARTGYSYVEPLMKKLGEWDFFSSKEVSDVLFGLWNGWAWDKLFRRDFILAAGLRFQNLQSSNDAFFVHAALASADRISLCNEILVHHRTGNQSSVSNKRDCAWESCLLYLKALHQYLGERRIFSVFERSYVNWTAEFLYWNYQTLNDSNRRSLAQKAREFFADELSVMKYGREYYYDAFSYWFVECIMNHEEDKLPLTEEERFQKIYQLNASKIEVLQKYIEERHWRTALWGAGIRGQAFAGEYGKSWTSLQTAYDRNQDKHGKVLCHEITIKGFHKQQENVDCILILNSAHLLSVQEELYGEDIVLFDMNTYLTMPYEIQDCILECAYS
ncbi:MAG: glycosyltransferase [Muribaculaceae bacterium]|nr:glycosyltransferase [Muribaculaceae bacterium]